MNERVIDLTTDALQTMVTKAVESVRAPQEPEVLTLKMVADLLGFSTRTVMEVLVQERNLPVYYPVPTQPRFKRSECLAWLGKQPRKGKHGGS